MHMQKKVKSVGRSPVQRKGLQPNQQGSGVEVPPFEGEIDRQIGDLLPQQSRSQIVSRVTAVLMSEKFSGPIAHPRHLREYEDICPGAAERIIAMAETRNNHNIEIQKMAIHAEISDRKRGMYMGALLFATILISALIVALQTGNEVIVAAFLTAAAAGGVGLFIKGRGTPE